MGTFSSNFGRLAYELQLAWRDDMEGAGGGEVQSEYGARIYSQKYSRRGLYEIKVLGPSLW